jgi:hypothetical protein
MFVARVCAQTVRKSKVESTATLLVSTTGMVETQVRKLLQCNYMGICPMYICVHLDGKISGFTTPTLSSEGVRERNLPAFIICITHFVETSLWIRVVVASNQQASKATFNSTWKLVGKLDPSD